MKKQEEQKITSSLNIPIIIANSFFFRLLFRYYTPVTESPCVNLDKQTWTQTTFKQSNNTNRSIKTINLSEIFVETKDERPNERETKKKNTRTNKEYLRSYMDEMANNKDEEADEELLGQLKVFDEIKKRSTFQHRLCRFWKSLKLRRAFGHFGLMVSLSIYCVVGGVVSMSNRLYC